MLSAEAKVPFDAPVDENSLTVLSPRLVTYRLPAASNARPEGELSPEEANVLTFPAESIWLTVLLSKLETYNNWPARDGGVDIRAQTAARANAVRIRYVIGSDFPWG